MYNVLQVYRYFSSMLEIVLLWRIQYNTLYRETMIYSSMKISGA